jgi:tripartite-type tricarboxylate transporter receptor subunit TctC
MPREHVLKGKIMSRLVLTVLVCLTAIGARSASAENYPSRPIRIVVPFSAGGAIDILARVMAKGLTEDFGQSVFVENKPGASGNIGAEVVSKSAPDGYTLMVTASTLIVNPVIALNPPPINPLTDLSYISLLAKGPLLFIVHPSVANSVSDFVTKAKAHPEKYNLATGGFGAAGHLAAEDFKVKAGLSIPVILYKGTGPVFSDLVGGHISGILDPLSTSLPLAKGGKVKAIGITSLKRSPLAPDVPTLDELGYKGFEFYTWYGLWAPPHMPKGISNKLADALDKFGKSPEMQKWFMSRGLEYSGLRGQKFLDYAKADQTKQAEIVEKAHIQKQ